MKILIADDDPIANAVLEASLTALGHEVVQATDGLGAWEIIQAQPVRVVVSDWKMPGLDGFELCKRIRARPAEYTYFILLSAAGTGDGNMSQAITAGVDDFLSKPVNLEELRMRLHVAERILQYTTQIRQLESFIPICSYCHKVRDDEDYWDQIETYINSRTGSRFSHGVCPDCYDRVLVPQMEAAGVTPPPLAGRPAHQCKPDRPAR
jgi:sigma-B regulation protein RsbU (phosphoserine phosphatase)